MILTSDTGGGHRSVSEALHDALLGIEPGLAVEIVDVLRTCLPGPFKHLDRAYAHVVRRLSWLWWASWHATDRPAAAESLGRFLVHLGGWAVEELLDTHEPHVVVVTHPFATHLAAAKSGGRPVITVITDLVSVHSAWLCHGVDGCLVATEPAAQRAMSAGIPPTVIRVTGLPVHPRFANGSCTSIEARALLGLEHDLFTALFIGGSDGTTDLAGQVEALAATGIRAQALVVAGRNAALAERLRMRAWPMPVHVFGFDRRIDRLMRAADVIVTRAGPSTLAEALVSARPIILTGRIPGQEDGNVELLVSSGAARLALTRPALTAALRDLAREACHRGASEAAIRLARPEAATHAAHAILEFANSHVNGGGHPSAPHYPEDQVEHERQQDADQQAAR